MTLKKNADASVARRTLDELDTPFEGGSRASSELWGDGYRSRGAVRAEIAESIRVKLQNELLRAIDDFRRSEADIPTRPEAIRRLLRQAVAISLPFETGGRNR